MFSSRVSSIAANRSQRSLNTNKRGNALLNLSKRSAANTSLNRSLQSSHLFEETSNHVIEAFGVPLPVLVAETLTLSDRNSTASVKLSDKGWAWLVCGRQLFIWKFKPSSDTRSNVSNCRELTLPSSDLAHKAELVSVIVSEKETSSMSQPAAIAVSPEGLVRYWPSIAHEGSYLETSADLHGQECFSLTDIHPLGCILATTTSSLILLTTKNSTGQNNIQCHNLKMPQGMLAGISRRVSSLIFGAIPSPTTDSKLARILASESGDPYVKELHVLFGPNFQKWRILDQEPEQFVYEIDLDRIVRDGFVSAVWGQEVGDVKTWMMDMQSTKNGVVILFAAVNLGMSQLVHFALGYLDTSSDSPPTNFNDFVLIRYSELFNENEDLMQRFRLVNMPHNSQATYIYSKHVILCVSGDEEPEKIEFRSQSDQILGCGLFDKVTLFFINSKGIVSLKSTQNFGANVSMSINETLPIETADLDASVALNISTAPNPADFEDDRVITLKSALIHFIKKELKKCEELLSEHFAESSSTIGQTSSLDETVYLLSRSMIDDFPSSDPRWAESYSQDAATSTGLLLILNHLEGKQKACNYLMLFLKSTGLLARLNSVRIGNDVFDTKTLLHEHLEKLVAATTLRTIHSNVSGIINAAIHDVMKNKQIAISGKLTEQDHFYREVSNIHEIVPTIIDNEMRCLSSDIPQQEIVNHISTVNKVLQEIFCSVLKFRHSKGLEELSHPIVNPALSQLWTNAEGNDGIRILLLKQYSITIEQANKKTDDIQIRGLLFQQMVDIADIILDGYVGQLESLKDSIDRYNLLFSKYSSDRYKLIHPFLEFNQLERAAALAEKYCDFKILVQLCEISDDQERLQRYMAQFAQDGFSDYVFKWYLDEGKRGKLLKQKFGHTESLEKFLSIHPSLSWVHHLQNGSYEKAYHTLNELAVKETNFIGRKKTLLSLRKLTTLASDSSNDVKESLVEDINHQQDLILHQETLPAVVIEAFGMSAEDMRVLSPQELIKMYVCDENSGANEYDFKKAIDLLQFLKPNESTDDEDEATDLNLHIFSKAILRDSWTELDTDSPLDSLKSTIFFRVLDLAFKSGIDLNEFLPPLENLLEREELSDISNDSTFRFLLQAGYEHIQQFVD